MSDVEFLKEDIREIKSDIKELRKELSSLIIFKAQVIGVASFFGAIAGLVIEWIKK